MKKYIYKNKWNSNIFLKNLEIFKLKSIFEITLVLKG